MPANFHVEPVLGQVADSASASEKGVVPRLLIIEDDREISKLLTINLSSLNYQVECSADGAEGLQRALHEPFDLLILDLMLPSLDGLQVCSQLRGAGSTLPILMLTARQSEADRVVGLELGADDYLTKPFSVRELQARVKAMLRRVALLAPANANPTELSEPDNTLLCFDNLEIDKACRKVVLAGRVIELTTKEFDLLYYLAEHPGKVFTRAQLLASVWGYRHSGYEHTVNSHMNRLRAKLEVDPANPVFVLTVWGVGYKFNDALTSR